jgi:hypothetical protein
MLPTPPPGSKISVTTEGPDEVIVIPYRDSAVIRYLFRLIALVWLTVFTSALAGFGWAAYFGTLQGNTSVEVTMTFVVLGLNEIIGILHLYVWLRPVVPETLKLQYDSVIYDSGIPPYHPWFGFGYPRPRYPSLADLEQPRLSRFRRTRVELDLHQVRAIRLTETDSGNRLTVDLGSSRIDIARSATEIEHEWLIDIARDATEIEREWLAKLLSERYGDRLGGVKRPQPRRILSGGDFR